MTWRTAAALAEMARPHTAALTAVGAVACLAITPTAAPLLVYLGVGAIVSRVASAGFIINDVFDLERDRTTHPERPLPQRRCTRGAAIAAAAVLFCLALAAAVPLGLAPAIVVAANIALLSVYSFVKQRHGLLANVATAYLSASLALLAGVAGGGLQPLLPAMVFFFFANLARETVLDVNDVEGDRAAGLRTFPVLFGDRAVFRFTWAILVFLAVLFVGLAVFGKVQRPLVFLVLILAALSVFGVALRRYQRARDREAFRSFARLTRWAAVVSLPAFLAGGVAAASARAAGDVSGSGGTGWLPQGALAFAVAGVALAFFWTTNRLIFDYNREGSKEFARIDARWRFYSVFGAMMFVFSFHFLAYALSPVPAGGFFATLPQTPWRALLFALGFVPLPVLWLELAFTQASDTIGFTGYYEKNCREKYPKLIDNYFKRQERFRRKEKAEVRESVSHFAYFAVAWSWIYVVAPITTLHLRRNLENPALETRGERWFQFAEDLVVALTAALFFACLIAAGTFAFSSGWDAEETRAVWLRWVVWAYLSLAALATALALALLGNRALAVKSIFPPRTLPVAGLVLYTLAVSWDVTRWGSVGSVAGGSTGFESGPLAWSGGCATWVLLALLVYLMNLFHRQLREARRLTHLWATLADTALHRFGNLLVAPSVTLSLLKEEIRVAATLSALTKDESRRQELLNQVENALGTVGSAQQILRDLKSHARRATQERWFPLNTDVLPQPEHRRGDGPPAWELTVEVTAPPPGLELRADPIDLRDALQNLVENARQALDKNVARREIRVKVDWEPARIYPLTLAVWNSGPPIPEHVKANLFRPGFSTHSGSGLGLYMVQEFMTRVGGRVDCESPKEEGTMFSLKFPAQRVRASRTDAGGRPSSPLMALAWKENRP